MPMAGDSTAQQHVLIIYYTKWNSKKNIEKTALSCKFLLQIWIWYMYLDYY